MDECRECGSPLIQVGGELVCPSCGYVAETIPYMGPEWRTDSPREHQRRARAGAPLTPLIHDLGLTTQGLGIRLRREERRLTETLSQLHGIAGKLGLGGAVEETAATIARKALKMLPNNTPTQAIASASLYLAMRIHGLPRSLREVSIKAGISHHTLSRAYNLISQKLGLKPPMRRAEEVIMRLAKELGLNGRLVEESLNLLGRLRSRGLTQGRKPETLASTCIYLAAKKLGQPISQRKICGLTGVSTTTLRKTLKKMVKLHLREPSTSRKEA